MTNEEPGRWAGSLAPARRDRETQWPQDLGMEEAGRPVGQGDAVAGGPRRGPEMKSIDDISTHTCNFSKAMPLTIIQR